MKTPIHLFIMIFLIFMILIIKGVDSQIISPLKELHNSSNIIKAEYFQNLKSEKDIIKLDSLKLEHNLLISNFPNNWYNLVLKIEKI